MCETGTGGRLNEFGPPLTMVQTPIHLPPRVGVRLGDHTFDAVPVLLRGQEASLVMDHAPREEDHVQLLLDWSDGRITELGARVRSIDGEGRIAHMDVYQVDGDWRPFLEYLGSSICVMA